MKNNYSHQVTLKQLYWCTHCNLPLILNKCDICNNNPIKVNHSPPGEFRPASFQFIKDFETLLKNYFGIEIVLSEHGIVLNKIGGVDRTDEVIIDGYNIGIYLYNLERGVHEFQPNEMAVMLFADLAKKRVVNYRNIRNIHLKNNWLKIKDLIQIDVNTLEDLDWIFIKNGIHRGAGVWHKDTGIKVKSLSSQNAFLSSVKFDRKKMASANKSALLYLINNSVNELTNIINEYKDVKPFTVSISGGKDSLVAFHIFNNIYSDFDLIYIDTGIEFKENKLFVERISKEYGKRLYIADAGSAFENNFPTFGPPGKDFRWCCKVAKLGPVTKLLKERYPAGSVSIEGRRWLESFERSRITFKEKNPFVPGQIQINPIRAWNAMEVWLYIYSFNLPYNELYELDIERLGCYMCPASLESEYHHIKNFHPDLANSWNKKLEEWRKNNDYSLDYINKGLWRWKNLPPKLSKYSSTIGKHNDISKSSGLSLNYTAPSITCSDGNRYSVNGVLRIPDNHGFESSANGLQILGKVSYSNEFNVVILKGKGGEHGTIFANGEISVSADSSNKAKIFFERIVKQIIRVQLCTKCEICEKKCPRKAIVINSTIIVDGDLCTRCGLCEEGCVLALYYDKLF